MLGWLLFYFGCLLGCLTIRLTDRFLAHLLWLVTCLVGYLLSQLLTLLVTCLVSYLLGRLLAWLATCLVVYLLS